METCKKCGVPHWPIRVYEKWIAKYDGRAHTPAFKEQVAGWAYVVERHNTGDMTLRPARRARGRPRKQGVDKE